MPYETPTTGTQHQGVQPPPRAAEPADAIRATPPIDPAPSEAKHTPQESEVEAEIIRAYSPDGRPADPWFRGKHLAILGGIVVLGGVVGAAIIGTFVGWAAGVAVLVLGLGLGIVANPEVWAAIARASERGRVDADQQRAGAPTGRE